MFGIDLKKKPLSVYEAIVGKQKSRKEIMELNAWKSHVRMLCKLIDKEIYELNDARMPFLWDNKITIKQEKRTSLRILLEANTLEELKEKATTLKNQARVIQGWTSRSKELLNAIIDGLRPTQLDDFESSGLSRKINNLLNKI